jgi:hypothetical protein
MRDMHTYIYIRGLFTMKSTLQEKVVSEQKELFHDSSYSAQSVFVPRLLRSFWRRVCARRGIVAYLPLGVAVLLLFCGASWQMFGIHTDAAHYQCYALAFWQGSQSTSSLPAHQCDFFSQFGIPQSSAERFHVLPIEYPPLTLSLFSVALLAPLHYYQIAFAILMALAALPIYWLLQRYGPYGSALACAFSLVIGAWATAEGRFDLVPAGLTLLCVIAAERRRWTLAYVALALGFLFKIYPILLLPALFIAEQIARDRFARPSASLRLSDWPRALWSTLRGARYWCWKNMFLFWALILVISGGFALLNFQGAVLSQWSYFTHRPVQVESTGSSVLWLFSLLGHPVHVVKSFGSINVISNSGHRVILLGEACFFIGYMLVILWQWRGTFDLSQTCVAILLLFIVTGKVFSPQYLIWLIPLLAYNGFFSRVWLVLWGSVCLLTTAIYPYMYNIRVGVHSFFAAPGFITLVALRNFLLLLITLAFFFNWWNLNHRKPPLLPDRETSNATVHEVLFPSTEPPQTETTLW